jgi:phosphoribosylaminoimidazole (AIR) synthetase
MATVSGPGLVQNLSRVLSDHLAAVFRNTRAVSAF